MKGYSGGISLSSAGVRRFSKGAAQPKGAKNLAAALSEKQAAGLDEAAKRTASDVKGKILEFAWWMKKQGYSEATIEGRSQILKRLARLARLGADLLDPENVKDIIARQDKWAPGRKAQVVYAYALFCKWLGLQWSPSKITVPGKIPFIPLEREIDDLIAGTTKHVAVALQLIKETGARVGEIFKLKWTDVDFATRTIRITPEKASNPRIFKISQKLAQMLENLPKTGEREY